MTALGVYAGNDPSAVRDFEAWLGLKVDFIAGHGGGSSWQDVRNTFSWLGNQFNGIDAPIYWTAPMLVGSGTLETGASGAYNAEYRAMAKTLVAASIGQSEIHVRVGHEFNGNWFAWAAKGKEAQFISTYRNFVEAFRSVSDKFVFEWNVNAGNMGMDPATAYPGDAWVDVIGMDFFYNTAWYPKDPTKAFEFMVNREYGLQWIEDFADAHGKPTAYSEWGINSDNAGPYVEGVAAWFESHNVSHQSYYNSNSDFPGKLSGGQYANTGQAFVEAFSGSVDGNAVPTPPQATAAWERWIGGTAGNDTLTGDDRCDKIDGQGGEDTMLGGQGDDIYTVDRAGDQVVEQAGQGIDTIDSYARNLTLFANVEHLNLQATYMQDGSGNGLDNRIVGNAQANRLTGRGGDDWLTSGAGRDVFVFTDYGGRDVVTDFQSGIDTLDFTALGFASAARVSAGTSRTAQGLEIDFPDGGGVLLLGVTEAQINGGYLL